ncbi:glutathione synthetase [Rubricoccus marinus]|uniref:Glutathione synthetase n=1 Tax=Rubricoccus marinus TaxID=716817 RepID=A0A259U2Z0_9BACT|nr:glutathione synthetase [Rubricoccus marinus]OZC04351.1 glutathione synthetase [Rubricoccus marinus]
MRIAFLINDYETEKDVFTTTRLALAAHKAGHEVCYLTVEDFICDPDETLRVRVRTPGGTYKTEKTFIEGIKGDDHVEHRMPVEEIDALLLRNDPADDAGSRSWAQSAGIVFGQMAARRGCLVLNDPEGLAKAVNKVYFQRFPESVRPKTLVTRHPDDVRHFIKEHGGDAIIKPFQGSGGDGVFVVRKDDHANLNQIIDAVCASGYMVVQEFLQEAAGADTRMFLVNGEPLQRDGVYAALRREGAEGDIRSNISAGGSAVEAVIGERELEIAEMVRPQLIQDGMFMVGLDIAGGILLEVNVFSPGGIGGIKQLTGVDFAPDVIAAVERKVLARQRYTQHFDNVTLATM